MCGIVGKAVRCGDKGLPDAEKQKQVLDLIRHRGPDMKGHYRDANVWFGHARLSILDLTDAAAQPMATEDSRYVICFNGEIYNFLEIAKSLGLSDLRSHSDTEVLLRAFAKIGIDSLLHLNGMFAFAVYDKKTKKVWLVRDRLGIKPLYYRLNKDGLVFASELKALIALSDEIACCNLSAIHEWVYYGFSLGEQTFYQGTKQLLPGHFLEVDLNTLDSNIGCYWSPTQYVDCQKSVASTDEHISHTRNLLEQAVKRQLVSDVPVGIFLSGGIDSSAITAFAARHYQGKLTTYSAGFDFNEGANELPKAREIAKRYGTDHHEVFIEGGNIADIVEKMIDHHDSPFSDPANIPLFLLSSSIKNKTKVILQGDGGDEMFGGYQRYSTLSYYNTFWLLAKIGQVANFLAPRNLQYHRRKRYIDVLKQNDLTKSMALLLTEENSDSNPTQIFASEFRKIISQNNPFARINEVQKQFRDTDIVNQMFFVDSMITLPDKFLEKVDRSTMAASVEVRVPFLDNDLVDFCMRLSGPQKVPYGRKKWLLKKALQGLVPDSVLYGKKVGLTVPLGYWLRSDLKPLFFDNLNVFQRKYPGILDKLVIESLYKEHVSGKRRRAFLLWKAMNFMIWANKRSISFQ